MKKHTCIDCGEPAFFRYTNLDQTENGETLCGVCAANEAADGSYIKRIKEVTQ